MPLWFTHGGSDSSAAGSRGAGGGAGSVLVTVAVRPEQAATNAATQRAWWRCIVLLMCCELAKHVPLLHATIVYCVHCRLFKGAIDVLDATSKAATVRTLTR